MEETATQITDTIANRTTEEEIKKTPITGVLTENIQREIDNGQLKVLTLCWHGSGRSVQQAHAFRTKGIAANYLSKGLEGLIGQAEKTDNPNSYLSKAAEQISNVTVVMNLLSPGETTSRLAHYFLKVLQAHMRMKGKAYVGEGEEGDMWKKLAATLYPPENKNQ